MSLANQAACPTCGAPVSFKLKSSFFGVCPYCNSMLVRTDMALEDIGKMSEMPQDLSPLQVGTRGAYNQLKFEIVGRQRVGWEQGAWNEWYLYFENGKDGWLADAQGFCAMSVQVRDAKLPDLSTLKVSSSVNLLGIEYKIDDLREVSCIASQGELPMKCLKGRKTTSVDLVAAEQKFGTMEYSADGDKLFLGKYVELESLALSNLRQIDGW